MPDQLNARQQRFVAEYAVDGNATQAAIRAGYSSRTAQEQSARLLSKAMIQQAVADAQAKLQVKTDITVDRILRELGIIAFSDVRHFTIDEKGRLMLTEGAPDEAWRAVSSVKYTPIPGIDRWQVEFKLWNKNGALDLAGKHFGMYLTRLANPDGSAIDFVGQSRDAEIDTVRAAAEYLDSMPDGGDAGKVLPWRKAS